MFESTYVIYLILLILSGVAFIIGLSCTAYAVFLFVKEREKKALGIPMWIPVLLAGLAMTLIIPGILIFLLGAMSYIEVVSTPTCYAPAVDPMLENATMMAGTVVAARGQLLEKLHEEGKVPESIYNKIKKI
ncbi:hypothetical protein CUJ83_06810 [Methanocella sp. CWC-04]|uniref:Uncharacterized protein n=1 Tax=Methanooceanicella nereidis TaxID=2052831 RepID=A0AAP2RBZ0_9EURY|nr:hypothetical protein [Methanocella sp. CWC-04]MCD1294709.1 hypothetical protein [Methanocella sp. CWC-04]